MPSGLLKTVYEETEGNISEIASRFSVSLQSTAIRADELNLTTYPDLMPGQAEQFPKATLRLFISIDIVGSTAYKQSTKKEDGDDLLG